MFIVYGTKGVISDLDWGEFACPGCGWARRTYARKSVRRHFTLFFIPLFPVSGATEFIECQSCGGQFDERVLVQAREVRKVIDRTAFFEDVKRLLVLAAMADGDANDAEIAAIRATYGEVSGQGLSKSDVDRESYLARLARGGLAPYPRQLSGEAEVSDKEEAIRAMLAVLVADGPMGDDERRFLDDVAAEMGLTPAHLRGLVAEVTGSS
jgi:tellurite resistance protein